jgi:hypothetical protein
MTEPPLIQRRRPARTQTADADSVGHNVRRSRPTTADSFRVHLRCLVDPGGLGVRHGPNAVGSCANTARHWPVPDPRRLSNLRLDGTGRVHCITNRDPRDQLFGREAGDLGLYALAFAGSERMACTSHVCPRRRSWPYSGIMFCCAYVRRTSDSRSDHHISHRRSGGRAITIARNTSSPR